MIAPVIRWTEFPDYRALHKTEQEATWPQLLERIRSAGPFPNKDAAPLLVLGAFGIKRTKDHSLRHAANLLQLHGVVGDYDAEAVSMAEALARLERAGIRAAIYPSASHLTNNPPKSHGGPRWRVLCPLATPAPPGEHSRLVARLNGALGGILAGESFTLSQSFYFGRIEGKPWEVLPTWADPEEGHCIDELHELDAIAKGKPTRTADPATGTAGPVEVGIFADRVQALGRKLREGDGRRELLKTFAASRSSRGTPHGDLCLAMRGLAAEFFDPADPVDWENVDAIAAHFARKDYREPVDFSGLLTDPETGEIFPAIPARQKLPNVIGLADFMAELTPPVFIWRGILRRGWLYAMTAVPGSGKTAIALLMTLKLAKGWPIHGRETLPSRVLFLCGENPDDVRLRMEMLMQAHNVAPEEIEGRVYFTRRPFAIDNPASLSEFVADAMQHGPFDVCFIDTGTAHSEAEEENDNRAMHELAMAMRELTAPIGQPCTVALMHPVQGAQRDNLRPRGGSAFTGSVDGLLCVWRDGPQSNSELFPHASKFRGETFDPLAFELKCLDHPDLRDNFGYAARSVIAAEVNSEAPHQDDLDGKQAAEALMRQQAMRDLTRLLAEFYERGDWVASSQQSTTTNAYAMLHAEPGFPYGLKRSDTFALCRELERKGYLIREEYADRHRNKRERWAVTAEGRTFAKLENTPAALAASACVSDALPGADAGDAIRDPNAAAQHPMLCVSALADSFSIGGNAANAVTQTAEVAP